MGATEIKRSKAEKTGSSPRGGLVESLTADIQKFGSGCTLAPECDI
ncbi:MULTISPECIES: hypothetical protein [Polaromonas]